MQSSEQAVTLFKINCDTCQTSLNVRQESAIGQILACPKCGSMVQVAPPKGWTTTEDQHPAPKSVKRPFLKPVPDPNLPETQSSISGSVSEGLQEKLVRRAEEKLNSGSRWQGEKDVDDNEPESKVVENDSSSSNRKTPADLKTPPGQKTTPSRDNSSVTPPPKQQVDKTEPVLPGDQWSSAKSQQQKKMLLIFVSTGAVLVFGIGAIVFATMQLSGRGNNNSAPNPSIADAKIGDENSEANAEPKNSAKKTTGTNENESSATDDQNSAKDKNDTATSEQKNPPVNESGSSNPDSENGEDNNSAAAGKSPTNVDAKDGNLDPTNTDTTNSKTEPNATDANAPPGFPEPDEEKPSKGIFDDFDAFTVFEVDKELLRARTGFTENDLSGTFGASRFFVERSLTKTPDRDRALNVKIEAVKFEQISLLEFIDFFYQGTSVPIAIDATPIVLAGIQLGEKFDFLARGKTFLEILRQVAEQRNLELIEDDKDCLILTIKNREILIEVEYPVGDVASSPGDLEALQLQIRKYVNQKSWAQVGGKGIITGNEKNNSIFVKHFGWAQVRIAELLRHIRSSQGIKLISPNANLPGGKNRIELSQDAKLNPLTIFESDPISLSRLFSQIAKSHGVHVLVNWKAVGQRLRPSGALPLAIDGEPFDQIIFELAEAMDLQVVWHSKDIVELTTDVGASSNLTLESYDISKSVQPGSTPTRLLSAIKKLLESNKLADFDRAVIGLDPKTEKTIFAVLPQEAHRNIMSILKYLESK